jgi:hypothetical protein
VLVRILVLTLGVLVVMSARSEASMQITLFAPNNATRLVTDGGADDQDLAVSSIQVSNLAVGSYVFNLTASHASTTGLLTFTNFSVGSITGTVDGAVGALLSINNIPTTSGGVYLKSSVGVSYLGTATGSSADVLYHALVDTTNSLSTVSYYANVVTPVPGGATIDRRVGQISTAGSSPSAWSYQGGDHESVLGASVALNLLVMADFSSSGPAVHAIQLNAQTKLTGSGIPEPASLGIWTPLVLGLWSLGRRGGGLPQGERS